MSVISDVDRAPATQPAGATVAARATWPTPSARWRWTRSRQAKSGHPGLPMGAADIATVLFTQFLKFDPADPTWPDRDRFVLSAGHGSMLIYALLYLTGYSSVTIDDIKKFRKLGFHDAGPSGKFRHARASRPPPARSARASPMRSAWRSPSGISPPYSATDAVDHKTYVLASDGDLMEGISQEAIALAGHLKLSRS